MNTMVEDLLKKYEVEKIKKTLLTFDNRDLTNYMINHTVKGISIIIKFVGIDRALSLDNYISSELIYEKNKTKKNYILIEKLSNLRSIINF